MKASDLTVPGFYGFTPQKGLPSVLSLQPGEPVLAYVLFSDESAPPPPARLVLTREFLVDQNIGGEFVGPLVPPT